MIHTVGFHRKRVSDGSFCIVEITVKQTLKLAHSLRRRPDPGLDDRSLIIRRIGLRVTIFAPVALHGPDLVPLDLRREIRTAYAPTRIGAGVVGAGLLGVKHTSRVIQVRDSFPLVYRSVRTGTAVVFVLVVRASCDSVRCVGCCRQDKTTGPHD